MKFFVFIMILFSMPIMLYNQEMPEAVHHPFSDKVIFSSEIGFTHSYTDFLYPQPTLLFRGLVEYFFTSYSTHAFGLRLKSGISNLNSFNYPYSDNNLNNNFKTNIFFLGGGLTYARKWDYSVPYLSVTFSHLRVDPRDNSGNLLPNNALRKYDININLYTLEFGLRFIMNNFWSVNLGLNYNFTNSDFIDDTKSGKSNDSFASLFFGISLYHGNKTYHKDKVNGGIVNNYTEHTAFEADSLEFKILHSDSVLTDQNSLHSLSVNDSSQYLKHTLHTELDQYNFIQDTNIQESEPLEFQLYKAENEKQLSNLIFTDGQYFCFQVGAFQKKHIAEEVTKELFDSGHNAFVIEATPFDDNEIWYRIRIGYFDSLVEAKSYKTKYFD